MWEKKCIKIYHLKTENMCLNTCTKHGQSIHFLLENIPIMVNLIINLVRGIIVNVREENINSFLFYFIWCEEKNTTHDIP